MIHPVNSNNKWEDEYFDSVFQQSLERMELRREQDREFTPEVLERTLEAMYAFESAYAKGEVQILREKATIAAYELYLERWRDEIAAQADGECKSDW
eukprot:m51a1_g12556 hypothetical protein (97) ;mRNA; f:2318-2769